jgi:hypothetical protein
MPLPHGTDRPESNRLVLRPVVPDDLPFYTRPHGSRQSRTICIPEAGRAHDLGVADRLPVA